MDVKDIEHLAVERIFLIPDSSEGVRGYLWCDDPAPGMGMDPSEAVEYVRKDVHEAIIAKQAKAAISGMDAAKAVASSNMEHAKRLHAECNPQTLDSERSANALLTERIAELEEREAALAAQVELLLAAGDLLREPWDLSNILGPETRRRVEGWDKAKARIDEPAASLAYRDQENMRKGFWWGFERARMHPGESNILAEWEDVKSLIESNQKHLSQQAEQC